MSDIEIVRGYIPGSLGRVASLHGTYYAQHWGFGLFFEAKVATELSEFLSHYHENRDGFWVAIEDGVIQGSIAIDGSHADTDGAHLRWFIVSDEVRGRGVGNLLIETAMDFCREHGYEKVYLWTFEGLDAAKHLYERVGFACVTEHEGEQWGTRVREQRFECTLPAELET